MNHLAHCFLSFGDEDVLLGNFIGDFVKGHDWQHYPELVQRGILLHRAIDSYTDNHPIADRSVARIRPYARRYSLFTLVGIAGEDDLDAPDLPTLHLHGDSSNLGHAEKMNGSAFGNRRASPRASIRIVA